MYKQSPGRNHRSKGVKVKHVLQVCLLLAVCFWLIYQVKRSHDKKKEFDETDAKFPIRTESSNEVVKLGRKDLLPRIDGLDRANENHREETEDETVEEEDGVKPEEEDLEVENNAKEKNDEHREDSEDEVDDHDQQKPDVEVDQEEDIVDEEKERGEDDEKETEERDSEETDNKVEEENSLEDHDHDEDSSGSHEAREEHYKADDASSAVTHDTGVTTTENNSGKLEQESEHAAEVKSEVGENNSMLIDADQSTTNLKVEDGKINGEGSPVNTTNSEEKDGDRISSTAADTSVSNSTRAEGLTDNSESATHSTEVRTQTHDLSLQNGTQAVTQEHNVTAEDTNSGGSNLSDSLSQQNSNSANMVDNNETDSNSTFSSKDGADSTPLDFSNMTGDMESLVEKVSQGNATVEAEDNVELPLKDDNATEVQKADTSDETETTDEGMDASISDNLRVVQDDPIDTSDSSFHLEEKHIRTDLETLPDIQTEGNMEDAAAE